MKKYKENKGITLIVLIVSIVLLVILAALVIMVVINNGLIDSADEASFKTRIGQIAEEWNFARVNYKLNNVNLNEFHAGKILKVLLADEEIDIEDDNIQDIRELLKNCGSEQENYIIIYEGELYYVSSSIVPNNTNQTKWCEELGIKIWEYTADNTGMKVVNGNYEKVNGIYLCTPKINTGFVKEKTRYMKEQNGNLVPTNWISKKPDEDWYDYKNKKWANLYVESTGIESYYVWIPRYVYKLAENGSQETDVKFVDINNNYTDGETDKVTKWEELKKEGYKIPEAFYFGDSETATENTAIPGYWISKYQLSELKETDSYTIDYDVVATPTTITIRNIRINAGGKEIAKYQYAVNGKILHESTNGEDYKITGLAKGNKAINVTALDKNGEVIGSMTKLYEVADVNEPDTRGFDPDTTFYVYWDENGIEHNETPISMEEPEEWYDYTSKKWANIVTRNNGLETYLVWIPRYQYALDTVSKSTYVKFIKGTGSETDSGYKIPEAFYFGDNETATKNTPLTGYWISKYQLSDKEATAKLTTEMSAGSDEIKIRNITGSVVGQNLKYEYYINGKKVHEGTDKNENYTYEGLEPKTTYTINIIARNKDTNAYVAAITQKVKTIVVNKPVLTGFNESRTYYVLYDNNGNESIGENIKNDGSNMPKGWYNYTDKKWANIVVTDGVVQNGKITGAKTTTYLVWIPRYSYSLDTTNKKTNVIFLEGTSNEVEPGHKIPEAFYWGDNETATQNTPLTGYWISKYQLSN